MEIWQIVLQHRTYPILKVVCSINMNIKKQFWKGFGKEVSSIRLWMDMKWTVMDKVRKNWFIKTILNTIIKKRCSNRTKISFSCEQSFMTRSYGELCHDTSHKLSILHTTFRIGYVRCWRTICHIYFFPKPLSKLLFYIHVLEKKCYKSEFKLQDNSFYFSA
jgi:hypothetical protein